MNSFEQRKQDILNKEDKSNIGDWDKRIIALCEKINASDKYYTTSSCSGRIMIIKDKDEKAPDLFEWVSHDSVSFEDFMKKIPKQGDFKFKQEPMILHIACKDIDGAGELLNKIRDAGWKRAGIISLGKNIVIEVIGTEKIEFPLMLNGKLLVEKDFLREVLERSNANLEKNWKKIENLEKSL